MPASLDHVPQSTQALDRRAASRDLWPGGTLARWQGEVPDLPARVFWPETDADVAAVLAAASEAGVPVVPYGAGSGVCGGARGRAGSWVVDTKRFDAVGAVDADAWTVEVGAGVNGQQLEDRLAAAGWTLGHSPSSIGCSTVGGWAAARGAGQFSSRYGVFEDMVLGADVVAPALGVAHVGLAGPSSAGPRLPDDDLALWLGSEGTLGVITRLRVRVRPRPEARWLRGYRVPDVPAALELMRRLMQGELWPAVVRLYDPLDTWVGGRTKPKPEAHGEAAWWQRWLAEVEALPAVRRRLLALPLAMPSVLQRVAESMTDGCLLIVGWEGRAPVVDAAVAAARPLLADAQDLGPAPGERWYASRHAVSYKLMPVFERGGFTDTMEIAARWSVLPTVYAAVREAAGPHALVMAHMSHVYPEGGCIYFSFAGRGDRAVYDRLWRAALDAVAACGATTTHHHGVGSLKAPWATREVGPAVAGWRSRKQTLDPAGVLNPGRVFVEDAGAPGPLPDPTLAPVDGLAWVPATGTVSRDDRLWPWPTAAAPPPWGREAWQTGWIDVRGEVSGEPCALGRAPRSATGPDLRGWLARHGDDVQATVAVTTTSQRWMARAALPAPWEAARAVLRADLRPAVLGVVEGVLHVGFRGPGAAAFGALATEVVPALTSCDWTPVGAASWPLVPCAADDPRAVHATTEHVWRPREDDDG